MESHAAGVVGRVGVLARATVGCADAAPGEETRMRVSSDLPVRRGGPWSKATSQPADLLAPRPWRAGPRRVSPLSLPPSP